MSSNIDDSRSKPILRVSGLLSGEMEFSYEEMSAIADEFQIPDVSQVVTSRSGRAIVLEGLLKQVPLSEGIDYIGLHGTLDDFHASIPLNAVRSTALLIYSLDGAALPEEKGGPVRFLIPDHAACHTAEIDECANVKYVDHIEFTAGKGYDNRPEDDQEHARLHEQQKNEKP